LLSTGYPTPCLTLSHQPPMVDSPFGLEPPPRIPLSCVPQPS
jgi:hypothetical protein